MRISPIPQPFVSWDALTGVSSDPGREASAEPRAASGDRDGCRVLAADAAQFSCKLNPGVSRSAALLFVASDWKYAQTPTSIESFGTATGTE